MPGASALVVLSLLRNSAPATASPTAPASHAAARANALANGDTCSSSGVMGSHRSSRQSADLQGGQLPSANAAAMCRAMCSTRLTSVGARATSSCGRHRHNSWYAGGAPASMNASRKHGSSTYRWRPNEAPGGGRTSGSGGASATATAAAQQLLPPAAFVAAVVSVAAGPGAVPPTPPLPPKLLLPPACGVLGVEPEPVEPEGEGEGAGVGQEGEEEEQAML